MKTTKLLQFTNNFFVSKTNSILDSLSLPWIPPIKSFKRKLYVQESSSSTTLAQFRYNMPPIGHKYPRFGKMSVERLCPLCPYRVLNSVSHLALFCPFVERTRTVQTSLSAFRNICISKGFTEEKTYHLLVNGFDWNENPVQASDFLERGRELSHIMDSWLDKW